MLSDDSFRSAVEEFACDIDDIDFVSEAANLEKDELKFLDEGMQASLNGEVKYRKSRVDFCNCESETDFAAKLYCVRLALTVSFIINWFEIKSIFKARSERWTQKSLAGKVWSNSPRWLHPPHETRSDEIL